MSDIKLRLSPFLDSGDRLEVLIPVGSEIPRSRPRISLEIHMADMNDANILVSTDCLEMVNALLLQGSEILRAQSM